MSYTDRRCDACQQEYELCECAETCDEPSDIAAPAPAPAVQHGGRKGKNRAGLSRAELASRGEQIAAALQGGRPIAFADGDPVQMLKAAAAALRRAQGV